MARIRVIRIKRSNPVATMSALLQAGSIRYGPGRAGRPTSGTEPAQQQGPVTR